MTNLLSLNKRLIKFNIFNQHNTSWLINLHQLHGIQSLNKSFISDGIIDEPLIHMQVENLHSSLGHLSSVNSDVLALQRQMEQAPFGSGSKSGENVIRASCWAPLYTPITKNGLKAATTGSLKRLFSSASIHIMPDSCWFGAMSGPGMPWCHDASPIQNANWTPGRPGRRQMCVHHQGQSINSRGSWL